MPVRILYNLSDAEAQALMESLIQEGIRSPEVRQEAISATLGKPDTLSALYQHLLVTTKYVPDPVGRELFTHPRKMVELKQELGYAPEDCDGLSIYAAAMYGSIGYPQKLGLLDTNRDGEIDHAVAYVYSERLDRWLTVDLANRFPLGWAWS